MPIAPLENRSGRALRGQPAFFHGVTRHPPASGHRVEYGPFGLATVIGVWTARVKGAARRWVQGVGDFTGYGCALAAAHVQVGDGIQQHARIRVTRVCE